MRGLEAYLLRLTVHDFYKYASREIGGDAYTLPFIHNTALLYATNRSRTRVLVVGSKPFYEEDFKKFKIYVTPAQLDLKVQLLGGREFSFGLAFEPVKITYNAVNTVTQLTEAGRAAVPLLGSYVSYPPLSTFRAYAIGGRPASVIRVGKKGAQCRVRAYPLKLIGKERGKYKPSHPVNPMDIDGVSKLISGQANPMPPVPLITNAVLEGEYFKFEDERGNKHFVAIPNTERFAGVSF